jgi:hypothetical protein
LVQNLYITALVSNKNLLSRARRQTNNTKDKICRNKFVRTHKTLKNSRGTEQIERHPVSHTVKRRFNLKKGVNSP